MRGICLKLVRHAVFEALQPGYRWRCVYACNKTWTGRVAIADRTAAQAGSLNHMALTEATRQLRKTRKGWKYVLPKGEGAVAPWLHHMVVKR